MTTGRINQVTIKRVDRSSESKGRPSSSPAKAGRLVFWVEAGRLRVGRGLITEGTLPRVSTYILPDPPNVAERFSNLKDGERSRRTGRDASKQTASASKGDSRPAVLAGTMGYVFASRICTGSSSSVDGCKKCICDRSFLRIFTEMSVSKQHRLFCKSRRQ